MIDPLTSWYIIFVMISIAFVVILKTVTEKKRYIFYCIFGMLFGFYFDMVSFTSNFYSYPDFFPLVILGLPLTMTIAEGFSVVIVIRLTEITTEIFRRHLHLTI